MVWCGRDRYNQAMFITDGTVPLERPLAAQTPPLRGFHWQDDLEEDAVLA